MFNLNRSHSCLPVFKANGLLLLSSLFLYECAKIRHSYFTLNEDVDTVQDARNKKKCSIPIHRIALYKTKFKRYVKNSFTGNCLYRIDEFLD